MTTSASPRRPTIMLTVKPVARDDPGGLLAQQASPAHPGTPGRGAKTVASAATGGSSWWPPARHSAATGGSWLVAPARVLVGEPDDAPRHLAAAWRSASGGGRSVWRRWICAGAGAAGSAVG